MVISNWLFTKYPLYISGFIGVGLSAIMGVTTYQKALAPFSHSIIFLFLGGFLFAKAMNKTKLDVRISLYILSRNILKGSIKRIIIALMGLTAFFSMWVSNTATTAMMLPITLGVLASLNIKEKRLISLILLGIAYSASIGGLGTPIGSIPNIVSIGLLAQTANIHINFVSWTLFGIPIVILFLIVLCLYIFKQIPTNTIKFDNKFLYKQFKELPSISKNEKWVLLLFLMTIFFWFSPSLLSTFLGKEHQIAIFFKERFNSGIVAMFFSSFLFIAPLSTSNKDGKGKILAQEDIKSIDWPSLLLFGTGLSLGKTLFDTGLANIVGNQILVLFSGSGVLVLLLVLVFFSIFSTEVASNTATANILIPIVIAMSLNLGLPPEILTVAIALACSLAFMLPVATPPNAIVYGSGLIDMNDMIKLGFKLNIICGVVLSLTFFFGYKFLY